MEALNLELFNFVHQNTAACQICTFYLGKQQSYKAFYVSHYDAIMIQALKLKINNTFDKTGQNNPCH